MSVPATARRQQLRRNGSADIGPAESGFGYTGSSADGGLPVEGTADGANAPAINTTARLDPSTCDGIVVLQSGSATLASEIGGDWLFWRAGVVGIDTLAMFEARRLLMLLGLGGIAILAAGGLVAVLGRGPARR